MNNVRWFLTLNNKSVLTNKEETMKKNAIIPIFKVVMVAILCATIGVALAAAPASAAWNQYTSPKEVTPFTVTNSGCVPDPIGDTFGHGPVQLDITSFCAQYTNTELVIKVQFNGSISPGDSGIHNAVVGYIDFDTDQNPSTGITSNVDGNSPYTTGLGVDYFVELFDYNSSTRDTPVEDASSNVVGRVPVIFTSRSFMVMIPLAMIGNNGKVNTATVLGTVHEATDAAPNGGYLTSSQAAPVPTVTPLGLIALAGVLGLVAVVAIRKRL